MSGSEMTFKQVENLIEEIKIITPTIENLLKKAKEMQDINTFANQNIKKLATTIEDFDMVLVEAVAFGIESKIEKLKEFEEFEKQLLKNVQIVKNAAQKIEPTRRINSLLIFSIGFLSCGFTLFIIEKGV